MRSELEGLGAPDSSWKRSAWAVIAIAIVPAALRLNLGFERVSDSGLLDLRGLLSDVAVSLLFAALLLPLSRVSRVVAAALLLPWCLLHYANFETVRVLGALAAAPDLAYLGDSTFFFGSAMAVSHPLLLISSLAVCLSLFWWAAPRASLRSIGTCAALGGLALLGHWAWPLSAEAALWRQVDFIQQNVERIASSTLYPYSSSERFRDAQTAVLDLMPEMAADLDGEPIVALDHPGTNVLLVILESVSGLHIHTLAADHGWDPQASMPHLDAIARSNISYSSFFTHQRRTNRGVYSILCGDLPNLLPGLPKMSSYLEGGRTCLPEILRRNGYDTVYVQSAPLAFMMKDRFMPLAGFSEVHGHKWFDRHYAQSRWGVDDRAMLERSSELIEELQKRGKPWFLTLLTVGTHHPYLFPEGFQVGRGSDEQRSLAYLDVAIGEFNHRLNELGVPKNTLVIYTSDESSALSTSRIVQNWGYLIARIPGGKQLRVKEPFAQMDIALSVLDFVGAARQAPHLFGRSVFRHYDDSRYIFFSNTNHFYAGARDPDGNLLLCSDDYETCSKFSFADGKFFGRESHPEPATSEEFEIVEGIGRRSIAGRHDDAPQRSFEMMVDPVFVVDASAKMTDQMIHGGLYVDLSEGEWVEVELEIEARGEPGARTKIVHYLRSLENERIRRWIQDLSAGQTLRLTYTYTPEQEAKGVQCRSMALTEGEHDLELNFKRARMTHHRSGEHPRFGIVVENLEVVQTGSEEHPAS